MKKSKRQSGRVCDARAGCFAPPVGWCRSCVEYALLQVIGARRLVVCARVSAPVVAAPVVSAPVVVVADDVFQHAAPRCMAHKTVAGLGAVITANGMRRWRWAWKTRLSGPESPTRISQGWSLPWARVELPKNGNWRLQRAEHCVAGSERAPWDGLSVLPLEPLSVSYGCSATGPNQKTTP